MDEGSKYSSSIKLLLIDIDGVMTNGTKSYDINGNYLSKSYNDKDFTAIKLLKISGVKVCFLSGDRKTNESMAKNRHIDFIFSRQKHKDLKNICNSYSVDIRDVGYVGDDYYDVPTLRMVGHSFCPSDAPLGVKKVCNKTLGTKGGSGVIAEIYDNEFGSRIDEDCLK